jgi:hypothetical protein
MHDDDDPSHSQLLAMNSLMKRAVYQRKLFSSDFGVLV